MSEAKFTQGPWIVKDGVVICKNPSDSYTRVAYAYSGHSTPYTDEVLNNAHLIAAAPEMYGMLNLIFNSCHSNADGTADVDMIKLKELLAKARGEK